MPPGGRIRKTHMTVPIRITFDRSANAAYIYLADLASGGAARTVHVENAHVRGMINLDFDASQRLVGVEVLEATHVLPPAVLDRADRI